MKKIIGILILLALAAIVVVQLGANKTISENRIYRYDKEKAIIIKASEVRTTNIAAENIFTGTFNANMDAKITADLQGKIIAYYVDAGSVVKKGQQLVKLDDALLRLQLEAVEVKIEGFEADVKRYKILNDAEAIQGVKLEKTEMALKAAKIQKNTLLEKISKTTIFAPFDGIVTMKMSEIGSFAAPGVPLLILTNISELKFIVNVSENNLDLFELNETYKIKVDAYPNLDVRGVVTSIGSQGNKGNSFPIQLEVQNTEDLKIKSKMFGKVILEGSENSKGIAIPATTIVGSDLEPQVYTVLNGKAVLQSIKIKRRLQNKVIVASGLIEGDIIVTNGFINLFDGANVTVK